MAFNGYRPDRLQWHDELWLAELLCAIMLSQNHGTNVVSDAVSGAGGLQVLVTKTGSTFT